MMCIYCDCYDVRLIAHSGVIEMERRSIYFKFLG